MKDDATVQLFATMKSLAADEKIIPIIRSALYDPQFKGFSIDIPDYEARPYDGHFHPSTHSLWTVRQLYLYLCAPQLISFEVMDMTSVLAITQGHFWHAFIQHILLMKGAITEAEVPVWDAETNRIGHADGHIEGTEGLEIKTINHFKIEKIDSVEVLKESKPQYWAQAQDYMDIMGWLTMRFLFINPDYPFRMKEFVVPADPLYQKRRRAEYREAVALAKEMGGWQALEDPYTKISACCAPESKQAKACPVRRACPIGRAS